MNSIKKILAYFSPVIIAYVVYTLMFNLDTTVRDKSGEITSGGQVALESLQTGDCFDYSALYSVSGTVSAKSCTETHDFEVYSVIDSSLNDYDKTMLENEAKQFCSETLPEERLMLIYENSNSELKAKMSRIITGDDVSGLEFQFFPAVPSHDSDPDIVGTWETGSRQITCFIGEEGSEFIGKIL